MTDTAHEHGGAPAVDAPAENPPGDEVHEEQQHLFDPPPAVVTDEPAPPKRRRWLVPAVVGAGVVVVIVVAVVLVASSSSGRSSQTDTFTRPNRTSTVGQASGGPRWSAVSGTWGVVDHQAYVDTPAPSGPNLLVAQRPMTDGTLTTTMARIADGAGLVFRYENPDNYWELVALPKVLSWQIYRVEQGQTSFVANTGSFTVVENGTTVAVRMRGARFDVVIDGEIRQTVQAPAPAAATRAGLIARGSQSDRARWTKFTVEPA